jgi:cellulose synthase/poly-beta-1,6-N-acetylglucosamine synthase-like glycosyltransferase
VDADFVMEMNKTFSKGYEVITCYRNSKNFGSNWISAGYSIWFLREARFLNYPRMLFGNSCAVSGTGFFVSGNIIRENGGWPFHLLTEDIEFSVNCALTGHKIGYCDRAVVYDEQPVSFKQSWTQRLRWSKGFYQVDAKYAAPLLRGIFTNKGNKMSCYDMFMTVAPGMLLTILTVALNVFLVFACFTKSGYMAYLILQEAFRFLLFAAINFYFGLAAYGLLTVISEWKHIRATPARKLMYIGVFPLFMATYLPIALVALIRRVEWKPIHHFTAGSFSMSVHEKDTGSAQRAC